MLFNKSATRVGDTRDQGLSPEYEQGNLSFLTRCEEDSDKLSAIFFLEIGAS